jgi:hypothetical protein
VTPEEKRLNDYRLEEVEKKVNKIEEVVGDLSEAVAILKVAATDLAKKVQTASEAADRMSTALFGLAGAVIVAAVTFAVSHA